MVPLPSTCRASLPLLAVLAGGCEGGAYDGPSRLDLADATATLHGGGGAVDGSLLLRVQLPLSAPRETEVWLHSLSAEVTLPNGQQPVVSIPSVTTDVDFPMVVDPGKLSEAKVEFRFELDAKLPTGFCSAGVPTVAYEAEIYDSLAYQHDPSGVDYKGVTSVRSEGVELSGAPVYPSQSAFPLVWQKQFGQLGEQSPDAVAATKGGGVVVAGTFGATLAIPGTTPLVVPAGSSAFLAALDADGVGVWSKSLGSGVTVRRVAAAPDGSVFAAGNVAPLSALTLGRVTIKAPRDEHPPWIAKVSAAGEPVYLGALRRLEDASIVTVDPRAFAVDAAGNARLAGGLRGAVEFEGQKITDANAEGMFVLAIDPAGAVASFQLVPAKQVLNVLALATDPAGGVVIGGWTGTTELELGGARPLPGSGIGVVIARYDASGALVFGQRFEVLDGGILDSMELAVDEQGRTYAAGVVTGTLLEVDEVAAPATFLMALEPTGELAWARNIAVGSIFPVGLARSGERVLAAVGFLGELEGDWGPPLVGGPALEGLALVAVDREGNMTHGAALGCAVTRAVLAVRPEQGDVIVAIGAAEVDFGAGPRSGLGTDFFLGALSLP